MAQSAEVLKSNRNKRAKDRYAQRVSLGLCIYCGNKPAEKSSTACLDCRDIRRVKANNQRKKWRADGLCGMCGGETNNPTCGNCRNKLKIMNKRRELRRKALGLCFRCAKPTDPNVCSSNVSHLMCFKCYMKQMAKMHLSSSDGWIHLVQLFNQQNGLCFYTKEKLILGDNASIDHITPLSRGGAENDITNLQWVTWTVNNCKRNLTHDEWVTLCRKVSS